MLAASICTALCCGSILFDAAHVRGKSVPHQAFKLAIPMRKSLSADSLLQLLAQSSLRSGNRHARRVAQLGRQHDLPRRSVSPAGLPGLRQSASFSNLPPGHTAMDDGHTAPLRVGKGHAELWGAANAVVAALSSGSHRRGALQRRQARTDV